MKRPSLTSGETVPVAPSMSDLLVRGTDRGLWLWLMELYENNYELLGRLCGPLRDLPDVWSSWRSDELWLTLRAQMLGPYTATFEYSVSLPGMALVTRARLYHDARLCEVISCRLDSGEGIDAQGGADQRVATESRNISIQEKWALNLRFRHWLEYALARGYFASRTSLAGRVMHPDLTGSYTNADSS